MARSLYRLLGSVMNTPHLITESALHPIIDYLQNRTFNSDSIVFEQSSDKVEKEEESPYLQDGTGTIIVDGTLTYKPVYGMCGPVGTSYLGILSQVEMLINEGADTIVMVHSSPGGMASHCFSTALDLRAMCDDANVKLVTYIDELSASAALALGVVADEVIIHPSASTGSVGCVICLHDLSKAYEKAGVKPVYISSTPGKTPFAQDGSFSASFIENLQEEVTRLGNEFAAHVSEFTSIPVKQIMKMDAKVFNAEKALELGLVNQILDHKQFAAYMADKKKGKRNA